jgi:N utilization substance protein B
MKSRTRARGLALQVLYEVDMAEHEPVAVFQARLEETPLTDELVEFARRIIFGVIPLIHDLDRLIAKYAPEWPLDQIAAIDRNILRISFWEFAVQRETPIKVAINEAVELAKQFGSDSAPRFINGVLGSLAEHKDEIHQHAQTLENK